MLKNQLSRVLGSAGLAASLTLAGCDSPVPVARIPRIPLAALAPSAEPGSPASKSASIIRVDDRISVVVAREPSLSLESVRVANDGYIDLPYLGRIKAAGRTTEQIGDDVRDALRETYLRDPRVAVNIVDYSSHVVTVEGAVGHPGQFTFNKDTTLLGAIASAGGTLRTAKLSRIAVFRSVNGVRSVAVFDIKALESGKEDDPLLEPGDQIHVGFSGLQQAWLDFLQAVPALAIFLRLY